MRDAFERNPFSIFLEIIKAYEKSKPCLFETHLKEILSRIYKNLQRKYLMNEKTYFVNSGTFNLLKEIRLTKNFNPFIDTYDEITLRK